MINNTEHQRQVILASITERQKQILFDFARWVTAFGCKQSDVPNQKVFTPVHQDSTNFYLLGPIETLLDTPDIFTNIVDEHIRTKTATISIPINKECPYYASYLTIFNYAIGLQTGCNLLVMGTQEMRGEDTRAVLRIIESIYTTTDTTVITFTPVFLSLLGLTNSDMLL